MLEANLISKDTVAIMAIINKVIHIYIFRLAMLMAVFVAVFPIGIVHQSKNANRATRLGQSRIPSSSRLKTTAPTFRVRAQVPEDKSSIDGALSDVV